MHKKGMDVVFIPKNFFSLTSDLPTNKTCCALMGSVFDLQLASDLDLDTAEKCTNTFMEDKSEQCRHRSMLSVHYNQSFARKHRDVYYYIPLSSPPTPPPFNTSLIFTTLPVDRH